MKWVSAVSEHRLLQYAVAECASEIENALDGQAPDLTVAFVSVHHSAHYDELPGIMRELFRPHLFAGCSGGGIIGAGREVENRPGFSLAAAVLPDTKLVGFRIEDADLPDGDAPPSAWEDIATAAAADDPQFLLLSDPFSVRGEHLLMGFDYAFPRSAKIGGLASGGQQSGVQRALPRRRNLQRRRSRRRPARQRRGRYDRSPGLPSDRPTDADNLL